MCVGVGVVCGCGWVGGWEVGMGVCEVGVGVWGGVCEEGESGGGWEEGEKM